MFLNLQKYLSRSETIIFRFGIGLQYIIVSISLWAIPLGGLSYYFRQTQGSRLFIEAPLIILILIIVYYLVRLLTTTYLVTDQKVYQSTSGRITQTLHTQINDMTVAQSVVERWLFRTGTLKFNTSGNSEPKIIMPRVQNPYTIKQAIYAAWK